MLPHGFNEADLEELLNLIAHLMAWLRVESFDEAEGEREAFERAQRVLLRYGKAT